MRVFDGFVVGMVAGCVCVSCHRDCALQIKQGTGGGGNSADAITDLAA